MAYMSCNHVCLMIALKWDKSFTIENHTFWITSLTWMGNTTSSREMVEAPLNPDSIHPGFSKVDDGNPICLNADICNRSVELLGSTKIHLTSKSLIPKFRIRASSWGCSTRLGSNGGKVITPSIGHVPLWGKPIRRELTCSLIETVWSNLCLFCLEFYFSSMGLPWM